MTKATDELTRSLRTVLSEIKPYGNHNSREFDDALLALGLYLERRIDGLTDLRKMQNQIASDGIRHVLKKMKPGYADGAEPQLSAKAKHEIEFGE